MPPPKPECEERRPYDTVNRRLEAWTERIRERYNRTPTTYELLAIDHFPCMASTQLFDHSDSGIIIYERLCHAEKTGNPSLLEEAGRLLMLQMTKAWTMVMSADGDFESCGGDAGTHTNLEVGLLNRIFLQQYRQREDDAAVSQGQQIPCNITYLAGAAEAWDRAIMGENIPFSNCNSKIGICEGKLHTVSSKSRAGNQNTFQGVFPLLSSVPPPVTAATTASSSSTTGNQCPTPSTATSTSLPCSQAANPNPANPKAPISPILQAHSINGNTYIIPITLHFANTVSNSSIAVHIPGVASAEYPLDLVSEKQRGVAKEIGQWEGVAGAGAGAGAGTRAGAGAGSVLENIAAI